METLTKKIINRLEDEHIPLANYCLSFVFITFIRYFIEGFSQTHNKLNFISAIVTEEMVHFLLSYITLAMLLIFLFYYATKLPIQKIIRVVLSGFILLWINPLIDLLLSYKTGVALLYLQPGVLNNLTYSYFTFFGDFSGASVGLKIEVAIALGAIYLYLRAKGLDRLLSLIYVWAAYSIIFLWAASPFMIQFIQHSFGFPYFFSSDMMVHFYLIINFILGVSLVYLTYPSLTRVIIKDIRPLRILHYELMLLFGVSLALNMSSYGIWQQLFFIRDSIINIILCMISLLFAALYTLISNNIADVEIDRISNSNRPLVKNEVSVKTYTEWGDWFLILALFYATMVNGKALMIIILFISTYYLYSMPPFRFKRIPLFSKLAISLNSLALILLGYSLVNQGIYAFPKILFFIYLLGVTVAANFIDLKDIAGDRAEGIMTLPVILGEKSAKIMIGMAFWVTYISFFYLIQNYYFLMILICAGGIQFYLINRTPYQESLVFIFYNLSILTLITILLLNR